MLHVQNFGGIAPAVAPHKLGELAQSAKNVALTRRQLEPMRGNQFVQALVKPIVNSIALYRPAENEYWFEFDQDVDLVPSPLYGDSYGQVFWTDGIKPKRTVAAIATATAPYPAATYDLGVPAFDGQVVAGSITGEPPESDFDKETRLYSVTYVTDEGYEGAPSLPGEIEIGVLQGCTVSGLPTSAPGNYNITSKRVYRGTKTTGELQFLAELPLSQDSFVDTALPESLNEALATYDYDLPPDDLIGLTVLPNGVLAGFHGNELCFSEPYVPYAWPAKYRISTEHDIVAIAAVGGGVFVATKGKPYIALGTEPGSILLQQMDSNQACASKASMVDVGNACIYSGPSGLVMGQAGGVQLIGEALFTQAQWQALTPESIRAFYHNEQYVFFYDNGSEQGGFILDPNAKQYALRELDFHATCGWSDLVTDTLYLLVDGNIVAFQKGDALSYVWRSGQFKLPNLMPYAAGRVIANSYPVNLSVINDGQSTDVEVQDDRPFRLPPLRRAQFVEVEIIGTSTLKEVLLGTDLESVNA